MLTPTREIRIETSTVCNFRCLMCARDTFTRPRQTMSNEQFLRIAASARQELPQLEMCTVSGFGELAADPAWPSKLEMARGLFPKVHVVTNLSLIGEDQLPVLAELATEVRVSLNALGEDRFQAVHRPPAGVTYAQIERRIRWLAARRGPEFHLRLSTLAIDENQEQIPAWIETWESLVDGLEVWKPHNWVNGKSYRHLSQARLTTCDRPARGPLQVQVDGTMNVCCFDYNGHLVIGDLEQQSFHEILTGRELCRIRQLHATDRADELPLCRVCDQRDPPEIRQAHLLYSSFADPSERVGRTSSGYERLGSG